MVESFWGLVGLDDVDGRRLIIRRLTRIQRLARQKRFEEIQSLLDRGYI
jgi:hypothetical protein